MSSVFCMATIMLPNYANDVVAAMMKNGYTVRAPCKNAFLHQRTNKLHAPIVLLLAIENQSDSAESCRKIYDHFEQALNDSGTLYYSTIVYTGNSFFGYSNIDFPELPPPPSGSIEP